MRIASAGALRSTVVWLAAIASSAADTWLAGESKGVSESCPLRAPALRPEVLVLTLVLPDGLGDVVFGECTVRELAASPATVTWVRAYPSEEAWLAGEALLDAAPSQRGSFAGAEARWHAGRAYSSPEAFVADLEQGRLDESWRHANAIFLAPWVFGIHAHDTSLLALARRMQREFWVLGEYGRGMGHVSSYTHGLGIRVPTGWSPEVSATAGSLAGGVFKTAQRMAQTGTDWRSHFAEELGLSDLPRLWWAYSRKDSAQTHAFRLLNTKAGGRWPQVAKIMPVAEDGSLAVGRQKTTGELLAEQASGLMQDPDHEVHLDTAGMSEVSSHIAGQLSELLLHVLTRDLPQEERGTPEVIVAPNIGVEAWAASKIVQVASLELLDPSGLVQRIAPGRPVYLIAEVVPRREMRTFLEQCETVVVATGDQSIAEAVLLGKVPLVRPDAKVAQWELAVEALATGRVDAVPDLGKVLRSLLWEAAARDRVAAWSRERSAEVEAHAEAKFGAERTATQETMLRAGMFG